MMEQPIVAEPAQVIEVEEVVEEDAGLPPLEEPETETVAVATVSVARMRATIARERNNSRRGVHESWVIPESAEDRRTQTMEALLRMTVSEEGWANHIGISALWQVAITTRGCMAEGDFAVPCSDPRSTRRRAHPLTSLWRHSPRATGRLPSRSRRGLWVSTLTLDCEQPSGWPSLTRRGTPYASWANYDDHCESLVEEIARVVDGESEVRACPPNSRPITWGCDPFRRRAICEVLGRHCNADGEANIAGCNDTPIAHRRNLERLDCGETSNAFWCRPGTPHCGTLPASERELLRRDAEAAAEDQVEDRPDEGLTLTPSATSS
jgi:hypothetical protein